MPYHTNTFLFHVSNNYFIGYKVTTPFFFEVEYSYQRDRFLEVLNIKMSIKAMDKLSTGGLNLTAEITEAARQHHDKLFNNPDDISAALSGMPQGKVKR